LTRLSGNNASYKRLDTNVGLESVKSTRAPSIAAAERATMKQELAEWKERKQTDIKKSEFSAVEEE